jgi:hypothetical protein
MTDVGRVSVGELLRPGRSPASGFVNPDSGLLDVMGI